MAQTVDIVTQSLERAVQLREAKEAVYTQIAANRRFLRDLSLQGLLTDEQDVWVRDFYPPKTRRNGDGDDSED